MSITLAIVEDLDEVRDGLKNFIGLSSDFKVLDTFKTAEEALYDIPRLKPDIVIMDISLPGMNGIECIKLVREKCPATQFMMFTVYENDDKVFEALKAGASGYLLKNTGLVQLIEALKELYNGGSPMSANIARKLVSFSGRTIRKINQSKSCRGAKMKSSSYWRRVYCIKKLPTSLVLVPIPFASIFIKYTTSCTCRTEPKPSIKHSEKNNLSAI